MTQMILNIENPDIIPSLRKVLGQLKGVSVAKTSRTKTAKSEKEEILQDIREAYTEVLEAQKTGTRLNNGRCFIFSRIRKEHEAACKEIQVFSV